MYAETIYSYDFLNAGRIKINRHLSDLNTIWSGGTGAYSRITMTLPFSGGSTNRAIGIYNSVLGGSGNTTNGRSSTVAGGHQNSAGTAYNAYGSFVGSGYKNLADNFSSFVGAGTLNYSYGALSVIGGGQQNKIGPYGTGSFIGGGFLNSANTSGAVVVGGQNNIARSSSAVVSGRYNRALGAYYTFIGGGMQNLAGNQGYTTNRASVVGGYQNSATTNNSVVVGGSTNFSNGTASFVGAGTANHAQGANSAVVAGTGNWAKTTFGFVGGGNSNSATTTYTTIGGGLLNLARGTRSFIGGGRENSSEASYGTIGGGQLNLVSGSGWGAVLGGYANSAMTLDSTVGGGYKNLATGICGFVGGGQANNAAHAYSAAFGCGSHTRSSFNVVIGGVVTSTPDVTNNTISLSGNGGDIVIEGSYIMGTADYAEYFEWVDGNPSNEDRVGYFVSLNGEKIEIGNDYVIGIISANPGVIGDVADLHWKDMYVKDEWGRKVMDRYKAYNVFVPPSASGESEGDTIILSANPRSRKVVFMDSEGTVFSEYPKPSCMEGIIYDNEIPDGATFEYISVPRVNEDFDPDMSYESRLARKEWSPVGLLGKLYVKTAESITGDFVDANEDGLAVNGTKYRVLKTIKSYQAPYGIVQVLFR